MSKNNFDNTIHSSQGVSSLPESDSSITTIERQAMLDDLDNDWTEGFFVPRTRIPYVEEDEINDHVLCGIDSDQQVWLDGHVLSIHDQSVILMKLQSQLIAEQTYRDEFAVYIYSFDKSFVTFLIANVQQLNTSNHLDVITKGDCIYAWMDKLFVASGRSGLCCVIGAEVGSFTILDQPALIYHTRDLWIQDICSVKKESEKDYSTSKFERKQKKKDVEVKQEQKVFEEVKREFKKNPSSAAKKKLKSRTPKHKHKTKPMQGVKPESTQDTVASIMEVLEKSGAMYLAFYADKPLYKGLAALFTLVRGSVSVEAYKLMMSLAQDVKSETSTLSDFTNWLKLAVVDIEKFKNNKFANSFFRLATKIVSTFICPDIAGRLNELFEGNAVYDAIKSIFEGETSPLEVFAQFFTYILNAVDVFLKTGELTGFLETQTIDDEFVSELREVRDSFTLFKNGNIEFVKDYKVYDFVRRMELLLVKMKTARKSRKSMELRELDRWIDELEKMKSVVAVD
jgi:hypothetical protein